MFKMQSLSFSHLKSWLWITGKIEELHDLAENIHFLLQFSITMFA